MIANDILWVESMLLTGSLSWLPSDEDSLTVASLYVRVTLYAGLLGPQKHSTMATSFCLQSEFVLILIFGFGGLTVQYEKAKHWNRVKRAKKNPE